MNGLGNMVIPMKKKVAADAATLIASCADTILFSARCSNGSAVGKMLGENCAVWECSGAGGEGACSAWATRARYEPKRRAPTAPMRGVNHQGYF